MKATEGGDKTAISHNIGDVVLGAIKDDEIRPVHDINKEALRPPIQHHEGDSPYRKAFLMLCE